MSLFNITGIEDGQTVRMSVGDKELFVTFRVEKSDYFRRDGADVHTDTDISIAQALLGGTIRIQGLYEDHTIQVFILNPLCLDLIYTIISIGYAWHIVTYKDKAKWKRYEKNQWLWAW